MGSHPLTGKESSSVQNSDLNLFDKAVILITPEDDNDEGFNENNNKLLEGT